MVAKRSAFCQEMAERILFAIGGLEAIKQERDGMKELTLTPTVTPHTIPKIEAPPEGLVKKRISQFANGEIPTVAVLKKEPITLVTKNTPEYQSTLAFQKFDEEEYIKSSKPLNSNGMDMGDMDQDRKEVAAVEGDNANALNAKLEEADMTVKKENTSDRGDFENHKATQHDDLKQEMKEVATTAVKGDIAGAHDTKLEEAGVKKGENGSSVTSKIENVSQGHSITDTASMSTVDADTNLPTATQKATEKGWRRLIPTWKRKRWKRKRWKGQRSSSTTL